MPATTAKLKQNAENKDRERERGLEKCWQNN